MPTLNTSANEWLWLESGASSAAENMAIDQTLLETAATAGKPILRVYSWTEPAATFGYFQKIAEIERLTSLRPLIRRPTGGGLVPHDADWTYSVIVPPQADWYQLAATESYRRIHDWLRLAFGEMGVPTELAPCCQPAGPGQCFIGYEQFDLLWHDKKIAGAAQRRTRDGLLIQGSIQPPPISLKREDWEKAMRAAAVETFGFAWEEFALSATFTARVQTLVNETYSAPDHNQRR